MLHSTSFPSVGVSVCPSVSQWVSLLVFVCPLLLSLSHIFSLTLTYLSSWHRLSTFACYLSKSALGEVTLQECRVYNQHSLQLFYASCDIVSQHWDYLYSHSKMYCGGTSSLDKVPSQSHPRGLFEHVTAKFRISRRTKRSGKNWKNRYTTHTSAFSVK